MPTQQPSAEQKKSEETEKKDVEITRAAPPALERSRPRSWPGIPRWMRRGLFAPYDPFTSSPFELMRRMSDDLDRMFSEYPFPEATASWAEAPALWSPDVEVFQHGDELVVRADLPGVNKEDLKVEMLENSLVLEGERHHEVERREAGYYRSERSYGSFRRVIPLPESARGADASAKYDAGVLEVRVKNPQAKGKKIDIKSSGAEGSRIH